ncbi:hypothetical protein ElyMa_000873400 [Elysia marginata]|uniref:Uncharacterized protein n=1 Tax=Elysia marginata TaxID=1093978 RepID=A0AAV4H5D1_9GAST|nr:hypothetical protein ElyMa_000873400 [Elysia marginata]
MPVTDTITLNAYRSVQDFALTKHAETGLRTKSNRFEPWSPVLLSSGRLDVAALSSLFRAKSPVARRSSVLLAFTPGKTSTVGTPRYCMVNTWLSCEGRTRLLVKNLTQVCEYLLSPNMTRKSSFRPLATTGGPEHPPFPPPKPPGTFSLNLLSGSSLDENGDGGHAPDTFELSESVPAGLQLLETELDDISNKKTSTTPHSTTPTAFPQTTEKCNAHVTYSSQEPVNKFQFSFSLSWDVSKGVTVRPHEHKPLSWESLECRVQHGQTAAVSDLVLLPPPTPDGHCDIIVTCRPGYFLVDGQCTYPYLVLLQINSVQGSALSEFSSHVSSTLSRLNTLQETKTGKSFTPLSVSCFSSLTHQEGDSRPTYYGVYDLKTLSSRHRLPIIENLNVSLSRTVYEGQPQPDFVVETTRACFVMNTGGERLVNITQGVKSSDVDPDDFSNEVIQDKEREAVDEANICKQKPWAYNGDSVLKNSIYKGGPSHQTPTLVCVDVTPIAFEIQPRNNADSSQDKNVYQNEPTIAHNTTDLTSIATASNRTGGNLDDIAATRNTTTSTSDGGERMYAKNWVVATLVIVTVLKIISPSEH